VPDDERAPRSNGCAAHGPARLASAGRHEASSAIAVATLDDRDVVLLADEDDRALRVLDARSLEPVAKTALHGAPKNLLVLADGRLAITLRDTGRLAILEPRDGTAADFDERCELEVPPEPWGIAEAGDRLLVTSAFGAAMTVFQGKDLALADTMKLPREPRSVLVDPSGEVAYVAHAVGGVVSAIDLGTPARLSKISVKAGSRQSPSGALVPRESTQGYALAGVVVNGP
jgi:DNA-binding beta-propeller fold protein YncE